jgi:UDP-2,4-diacetamido-2,4,6-trideoxy-beta-L-altropyranose hydrolase
LKAQGATTVFVCRDHTGHLFEAIQKQGHNCLLLPPPTTSIVTTPNREQCPPHRDWLGEDWETDVKQTLNALAGSHFDWLVVDHYALDARWENALRGCADQIMVIDDLADRQHDCDLLLDQTLGRESGDYAGRVPASCHLLTGSTYALLRPEFAAWRARSLERRNQPVLMKQVLLNMGGVDAANMTGQVLNALAASALPEGLMVTVVLGLAAPHRHDVTSLARSLPFRTNVMSHVDNMAELMANSDLAIGAAGTTSWERCCLGLPTLLFVLAPNQLDSASALQAAGAVMLVKTPDELADAVRTVCESPAILTTMSHAAAGLVQGDGAATVLSRLKEFA